MKTNQIFCYDISSQTLLAHRGHQHMYHGAMLVYLRLLYYVHSHCLQALRIKDILCHPFDIVTHAKCSNATLARLLSDVRILQDLARQRHPPSPHRRRQHITMQQCCFAFNHYQTMLLCLRPLCHE